MQQPNTDDRIVQVGAYLTDAEFGYDHWRASQFSSPPGSRPALLVICDSVENRDVLVDALATAPPGILVSRVALENLRTRYQAFLDSYTVDDAARRLIRDVIEDLST